jgi:hypothetical protein
MVEAAGAAVLPGSGSLAIAMMSDQEFETRLEQLRIAQSRVERIKAALMVKDTDYGVIPHTDKPTLLKPGAEKLCLAFRLVASFEETITYGDGVTRPQVSVDMRCDLHLGEAAGPVVGQGIGNANSWEKRYRYRKGERACPTCGVVGSIVKGNPAYERDPKYQGGWVCWNRKNGCGANFTADDPAIVGQQTGNVENEDPFDLLNTLKKIAKKRSHVDAALTTTGTSGLFTQDVEDMDAPAAAPAATSGGNGGASVTQAPAPPAKPAPQPAHFQGLDVPAEVAAILARMVQEARGIDEQNWPGKVKTANLSSALKLMETRGGFSKETAESTLHALQWAFDGEAHPKIDEELDCRFIGLISGHVEWFKDLKAAGEWWRLGHGGS